MQQEKGGNNNDDEEQTGRTKDRPGHDSIHTRSEKIGSEQNTHAAHTPKHPHDRRSPCNHTLWVLHTHAPLPLHAAAHSQHPPCSCRRHSAGWVLGAPMSPGPTPPPHPRPQSPHSTHPRRCRRPHRTMAGTCCQGEGRQRALLHPRGRCRAGRVCPPRAPGGRRAGQRRRWGSCCDPPVPGTCVVRSRMHTPQAQEREEEGWEGSGACEQQRGADFRVAGKRCSREGAKAMPASGGCCCRCWDSYSTLCRLTNALRMSCCVHACMCACVHVCMCACVHVCMCACVHVCMCACVWGV